jgi:hypothetical protein
MLQVDMPAWAVVAKVSNRLDISWLSGLISVIQDGSKALDNFTLNLASWKAPDLETHLPSATGCPPAISSPACHPSATE